MFYCQICGTTTTPGQPLARIVVQTRSKVYEGPKGEVIGLGFETVREVSACPGCAKQAVQG